MARYFTILVIVLAGTAPALAQPPGGSPGEGPLAGQRGPMGPPDGGPPSAVLSAIDADGDHVISAQEILNAATALNKLDKNQDGKLTSDEIHAGNSRDNQSQQVGTDRSQRNSSSSSSRRRGRSAAGQSGQTGTQATASGRPGPGGPGGPGGPPTAAGFMQHAATFDVNRDGVLNRAELEKMAVAFVAEMTRQGPPGGGPGPGGRQQPDARRGGR